MKYVSHIALPLLMLGLLALALVLPKFVQPKEEVSDSKPPEFAKIPDSVEMLPAYEPTPGDSQSGILVSHTTEIPQVDFKAAASNIDALLTPFLQKLQEGDLDGAEKALNTIGEKVPASVKSGLQYSLDSARESHKAMAIAKAETARAEHATKEAANLAKENVEKDRALAAAQSDIASGSEGNSLAKLNAEKIRSSILELNKATAAAKTAAKQAEQSALETARLRAALVAKSNAGGAIQSISETVTNTPAAPVELPAGSEVQFGFNSSVVPQSAQSSILKVAEVLKSRPRLGIQLRGYADSVGNPEYNAILSRARSQKVKDALVEQGVSIDRIDLIPFGASQSPRGSSADHRRVDLVFYEI